MALLDICKRVLAGTGWPVLSSIASNSDGTAQQIFALANDELRSLSEEYNWPQLEVEYAFPTVAAQTVYLWPADFRVMAQGAVFDASQYYEIKGSTGLQYWEMLKYGKLGNLGCAKFRTVYPLGAPAIEITPAPTGVRNLVGVYYSSQFARNSGGAGIPMFATDSDTSKIPERYIELGLKWRFRRAKGLDFSAELAEYNATISTQFAKTRANGEIAVGGRRLEQDVLTQGFVRENGFGV